MQQIPRPVLRRLPRYMILARELLADGQTWISSSDLAECLAVTTSTVRQDLSYIDIQGVPKRGYAANQLEAALRGILRSDHTHATVMVGAGNLGVALSLNLSADTGSFPVCAIFDKDPALSGRMVGTLPVMPMEMLKDVCRVHHVQIGVIAVPLTAAQKVADQLVDAGVGGILNLASVHIHVPDNVIVSDARLEARLQEIAAEIQFRSGVD